MFRGKRLAGFVFRVLLFYGLLVLPWPGVRQGYSVFYRESANLLFASSSDLIIRFRPRPLSKGDPSKDLEFAMSRRRESRERTTPIDTRLSGYLPTAELVALILATPIPWSRRGKALLWGLLWVSVFIALGHAILLLYSLTHPPAFIPDLNPVWGNVVYGVYEIIGRAPTPPFVVSILIWILVSFRGSDLSTIFGGSRRKRGHPRS